MYISKVDVFARIDRALKKVVWGKNRRKHILDAIEAELESLLEDYSKEFYRLRSVEQRKQLPDFKVGDSVKVIGTNLEYIVTSPPYFDWGVAKIHVHREDQGSLEFLTLEAGLLESKGTKGTKGK